VPDIERFLREKVKSDSAFRARVEEASMRAAQYSQHIDQLRAIPPAPTFDDVIDEAARFVEAFQKAHSGHEPYVPEGERRKDPRTPGTGRTGREEWT